MPPSKNGNQNAFDVRFSTEPSEKLMQEFGTSLSGLSHQEVRRRHHRYGFNQSSKAREPHILLQFLSRFTSPLVLVLLVVAGISLFLGQQVSAALVLGMAIVSVVLAFVQEYKAKTEAKKLLEIVSTTAAVIRDGRQHEVHIKTLVPGDIVYLSAGDIIPADLRVLSAKDLFINQAAMTGESFPAEKTGEAIAPKTATLTELTNIAFMGSNVVSGTGYGLILKTGDQTQFGQLAAHVSAQEGETSFDKGIREFVLLLIRFMIVMVVAIFAINAILKGNPLEALLFSLAVAVGLTPEMLPMIVTVNLSNGAIKMSGKKVIVKRLSSIQNFGAMDILCTDKTGTLTLGEVVLERHYDLRGTESQEVLRYGYMNSYFQTGLKNLLDKAILRHSHLSIAGYRKLDEIPFDFSRKLMSVVVEEDGKHILISKGAPEEIIKRCGSYELDGKVFRKAIPKSVIALTDKYRNEGFRVLAVAYRPFTTKKKAYTKEDEEGLILKGFMIFLDPPKPSAKDAIQSLEKLGIKLKVLTGDNELVTTKVCGDVGLDVGEVVTGDTVDALDDEGLRKIVDKTTVFARLNPLQKERVITALRANGHTVGYLGDGINDAPALKSADVGLSVNNAVDIAKETADIILLEKSLIVLQEGVLEGRKTYENMLKYIKMGSSSNFGNMLSVVGASLFLPFLPMLPIQILLNNFLYDMAQVSLPSDNVDEDNLDKPSPWNVDYIKRYMIFFGPISSLFDFTTYGVLLLFSASQPLFNTIWFIESLATQTLVINVIRTRKIPFLESRPSGYLLITTFGAVLVGLAITLSPFASAFGFVQPPLFYLGATTLIVATYLVLVQLLKVWFIRKYGYK
ncbi:MAG: magnesium-translocating P-type ATPase [Candidatus ainarchaeum sp.]|nr:magnesium-translocating P-type ATPase [Candidatus ainarchaeum sp.]